MELMAQHVAHQTDYVTFELDEYRDASGRQMLLAHLRVHRWSPSVFKRLRREFSEMRTGLYGSRWFCSENIVPIEQARTRRRANCDFHHRQARGLALM